MDARHLLPALLTIGTLLGPATARAATWVEAKSPNFTVYSDAGEKRARAIAWQFEQIRAALSRLWPWARFDFGAPIVVYAARDERSMRALLPRHFEGRNPVKPTSLLVSAPEAHYVALRTDVSTGGAVNVNPYFSSYWSYVALVIRASYDRTLPPWFERGLAEVFSNTIVSGKEIQVGQIIPWNIERLRALTRPTVEALLSADSQSPLLAGGERLATFDAMAWALVHYLTFGNQGKNIPIFNRFAMAVRDGADPNETLAEAYGGVIAVREGLARYIDQTLFVYQKVPVAIDISDAAFRVRQVPEPETAIELARFHAAMNQPVEARAQLASAGGPPAGAEVEAALLDREGKKEEARIAYGRACEAGAATFYGEYRFAALSWPPGGDVTADTLQAVERALQRSTALNPSFAPSHRMLAQALLRLNRHADALKAAERVEALERRDPYSHLLVSRALWGVSRPDEAMAAAKRALSLASTDQERRDAQTLVDFYAKASSPRSSGTAEREIGADEGRKLFEACNSGDANACNTLFAMFDRSCTAGDARGCMMTAFFYLEGKGVPQDESKGMAILEPLCTGDMPEACMPIATALFTRGDAANRARARELYEKSCKAGAEEACKVLQSIKW
jgi:tetratricopeptide (TPR) repeat protein